MREGWRIKKLGEISDIKTGKSNAVDADINGIYTFFDRSKKIKKSNRFLFDCESLIISGEGSQFFPRYFSGKFDLHQRVYSISNFPNDINIRFVEYFLIFNHKHFERVAVGATVKSLRLRHFTEIDIPIPQIEEQKQIVAILDKAFTAIDQAKANIEKNIVNAKELFQSKLNAIFSQKGDGWEEKTLIEVNKFIDYRGKTPQKTDSGIKLITAKNVRMGYLRNNPEEFIAVEAYDDWMTRGIPKKGDVLFTTEAPLANVTLLNTSEKIALAQRIITLCPNREILSGEYLTFCLQSKVIQDKILEKGTGATVTGIKSRLLKEIIIPIPPTKTQADIVNVMSQMKNHSDEVINNLEKKLESLEELKKSILQKAFAGELTQKEVVV